MTKANRGTTLDEAQVAHFDGDAGGRWGPAGPARWLHRYNPVRVPYIRHAACSAFGREAAGPEPLRGFRILDIGCGAGILCEPLAQLGASVVGVDPAESTIHVAAQRARQKNLEVEYRSATAEALAETGAWFDVVLAMEVIEHVADHRLFLRTCADLAGSNGLVILSTINRTVESWVQVIVFGEYILGLLCKRRTNFVPPAGRGSVGLSADPSHTQTGENSSVVDGISSVGFQLTPPHWHTVPPPQWYKIGPPFRPEAH